METKEAFIIIRYRRYGPIICLADKQGYAAVECIFSLMCFSAVALISCTLLRLAATTSGSYAPADTAYRLDAIRLRLFSFVSWLMLWLVYIITSYDTPVQSESLLGISLASLPTADRLTAAFRDSVRSAYGYIGFCSAVSIFVGVASQWVLWFVDSQLTPFFKPEVFELVPLAVMLSVGVTNYVESTRPVHSIAEFLACRCVMYFVCYNVFWAIWPILDNNGLRGSWKQVKAFAVVVCTSLTAPLLTYAIYQQTGEMDLALSATLFSWQFVGLAGGCLMQYFTYDDVLPSFTYGLWKYERRRIEVSRVSVFYTCTP
jgi:hypothetical protein